MAPTPAPPLGTFIDHNRFQLTSLLGTGSFASVFLALDRFQPASLSSPPAKYAVKCLPRGSGWKEAAFMRRVGGCENIVKLKKVVEEGEWVFLVMEWCEGDLYETITNHSGFPPLVAKEIFTQITAALSHCHSRSIYHRDIKPENFLVTHTGQIKLADFGLATYDRLSPDRGCGSSRYIAPEFIDANSRYWQHRRADKNDVWALGIVLINILFGRNPWHEAALSDPIYRSYMGVDGPRYTSVLKDQFGLSNEFDKILRRVFEPDPRKRVGVEEFRMLVEKCTEFFADEAATCGDCDDEGEGLDMELEFDFGIDGESDCGTDVDIGIGFDSSTLNSRKSDTPVSLYTSISSSPFPISPSPTSTFTNPSVSHIISTPLNTNTNTNTTHVTGCTAIVSIPPTTQAKNVEVMCTYPTHPSTHDSGFESGGECSSRSSVTGGGKSLG